MRGQTSTFCFSVISGDCPRSDARACSKPSMIGLDNMSISGGINYGENLPRTSKFHERPKALRRILFLDCRSSPFGAIFSIAIILRWRATPRNAWDCMLAPVPRDTGLGGDGRRRSGLDKSRTRVYEHIKYRCRVPYLGPQRESPRQIFADQRC